MKQLFFFGLLSLLSFEAKAAEVYSQPPSPAGGIIESSWYPPDGLDGDNYAYDSFVLSFSTSITEIRWRGGYTNSLHGAGESPVFDFTISIHPSIPAGTQPDVTAPPLAQYSVGDNAGETLVGTFGGIPMYEYHFILPSPFQAVAGTKYWLLIEASQGLTPVYYWPPDWGLTVGTGGDGTHFHAITGGTGGGGTLYQIRASDLTFSLLGAAGPTVAITASTSPVNGGTIMGEGAYPVGSTVSLLATPNPGFGFVSWTEGGAVVGNSPDYTFTAATDRTLVANFTPAYAITTSVSPIYGGSTSGDGVYNSGSSVTVVATPRVGYEFANWTDFGTPVSTSASYTFSAGADHALVANFTPGPLTVTFDFQSGTPAPVAQGTATPFDLTVSGVTGQFSSPQDSGPYHPAFSLQSDGNLKYHQVHLSGNYLWPGTVYRNDLDIRFSRPVTTISLDFATFDYQFAADIPSPLKITAYNDSTATTPVGSAQNTGQYAGTSYPEGAVTFSSATPFNVVEITVGPNNAGTVNFMADNIIVIRAVPGDFNGDGHVNNSDLPLFKICGSGPAIPLGPGCEDRDFDHDNDVDQSDFGVFQRCWSGPNVPGDPNCAN